MTFKILSLDGGGTWALLEVMALQDMYPGASGWEILSHFDLAVANSGGSIVLAGLALNMPISQIRSLFDDETKRRSIFHKKPLLEEDLCVVPIFPKYSASQKKIGLHGVMGSGGDKLLSQLPEQPNWPKGPSGEATRILVMGFDYDRQREDFLRSYAIPASAAQPDEVALADAVHASSNAPVIYFDAPAMVGKKRYWDGAMGGYNNPIMAAVVDALSLNISAEQMRVLSIGTGMVRLVPNDLASPSASPDICEPATKSGLLNDARLAAGCITDDPPDAASYTAHMVLNGTPNACKNVVRLSPLAQPIRDSKGEWQIPPQLREDVFFKLKKLGMDAVENDDVDTISQFGTAWIHSGLQNQPIRMTSDLSCALGDRTYTEGKTRWHALP